MTTACMLLLFAGIGAYMMRWWLWDSCNVAYKAEQLALDQADKCMARRDELYDRLANARSYAGMLYDSLGRAQSEAEDAQSYGYRLLEDRDYYESERERFLAAYVPSAPEPDFFNSFDRN